MGVGHVSALNIVNRSLLNVSVWGKSETASDSPLLLWLFIQTAANTNFIFACIVNFHVFSFSGSFSQLELMEGKLRVCPLCG